MNVNFAGDFAQVVMVFTLAMGVVAIIIHVIFAIAVFNDAGKLERTGLRVMFVNSVIWGLATLIGGVFVAISYWAIHHSTLSLESSKVRETLQSPESESENDESGYY